MADKIPKLRHCFNCGKPVGTYADWDRLDTCGERQCEREARYVRDAERDEAHEKLDRDMGW